MLDTIERRRKKEGGRERESDTNKLVSVQIDIFDNGFPFALMLTHKHTTHASDRVYTWEL